MPRTSNVVNLNNLNIGELPDECCAKCEYGVIIRDSEGKLIFQIRECREQSPHVQFFAVPRDPRAPPSPENTVVFEHAGHPKMPAVHKCGKFEARKGMSNVPIPDINDAVGGEA